MKLSLLSNDLDLLNILDATGYFTSVSTAASLQDTKDGQVVVISDNFIDHNELSLYFSGRKKENQIIFYMLSNRYNEQISQHINALCEAKNIEVVPPKLTVQQIVDRIVKKLFPEIGGKNQNIAVFFGADNKVGTTMTAQMTAEMLAKNTDLKVGLLCLNDRPSTAFVKVKDDENVGLDDIKIKLFNNILTPEELEITCIRTKELFILQGPRNILDVRFYHPEHVEYLIQLASKVFDIIIVDAGSDIRIGLAVGALRSSNIRYLVTTQQEESKRMFDRVDTQILKSLQLASSDFLLIVNKYIESDKIYSGRDMAGLYNMTLAALIPNMENTGWQAEYDRKSLLQYNNEEMNYSVEQICKLIAAQMKFEYNSEFKKEGFLKRLRSAGGSINSWL